MVGLALTKIGVDAGLSYLQGKSAYKQQQAQVAIQKANAYQSMAREYAQLTASVKAVGRQNEAIGKAEAYTFSNMLGNKGALELRDAQLRGVMARNKAQLRTDGSTNKATLTAQAGAVGAVGASVNAMQRDISKKVDQALTDLSQQRTNQVYDMNRQNQAMFTQFYQSQQLVDDSQIDEAFLPQMPLILGEGSGRGGKFLPHLIASGISFGANHMMQEWSLGLNKSNQQQSGNPVFSSGGGTATAYAYRG
ncbi:MAG: virion core protein, T7 gp14 family [Bacteroides sp.]